MNPPVDATHWQCSICDTWNYISQQQCSKCTHSVPKSYRTHSKLTPEEEQFYSGTALEILRELKEISSAIRALVRELQGP